MTINSKVALDRDPLVGPDPTWEQLPEGERHQWLTEIEDFPPPPMLLELMETDLRIENFDVGKLAAKFSSDPVLAGRLLGRANCAAIAPREPITSLRQAIVHLGFLLMRSMVMHYQIEQSAAQLQGIVRDHIIKIQKQTELGAVIAFNWARAVKHPDPTTPATRCLLGRLGTLLLARRHAAEMAGYFKAGHEPQRLNFEANHFQITTRTLTLKVAQWWGLPERLQTGLYHLWTPLFAQTDDIESCLACAAMALSFDPPMHMDDIQKWLSLRVHTRLRENLEQFGAIGRLPEMFDSDAYRHEMGAVMEG